MNDAIGWLSSQVAAVAVAAVWALVAAVKKKITRSNKFRGILAAHLPQVCLTYQGDEKRRHELALLCNESLTAQGEAPLGLGELEEVRQALKAPRAATVERAPPPPPKGK